MERLKTEREKAVQHAEDLGYQVEVLRAKLHEARRNLASRPAYDSVDLGYQAEQLLRNAQIQADQLRADAEREMREARAQTQRHPPGARRARRPASRPSCTPRPSAGASSSTRSWPSAGPTVESHVNENVAWAEQLRARSESQARRLLDESRAEAEQALPPPAPRPPGSPSRPGERLAAEAEAARAEAEQLLRGPAPTPSGC